KAGKFKILGGSISYIPESVRIPDIDVSLGNLECKEYEGLLDSLKGENNVFRKIVVNMKDVIANRFIALLGGTNMTVDEARVTTGNVNVGGTFATLWRIEGNSTIQKLTASYKDVSAGNAFIVSHNITNGSKILKSKFTMDSLLGSQYISLIDWLGGTVDSLVARINHVQTVQNSSAKDKWDRAYVNGIHTLSSNANVENMSIYADVYIKANADDYDVENVKETVATGLFYDGSGENIHLKNIFSAMRISKYTEVDSETGRPTDAKVIHNYPHALSGVGADNYYLQAMDGDNDKKTYRLDWAKDIDRVYWLKRDPSDVDWPLYPSELTSFDGTRALFPGIASEITDLILQPSMSVTVEQTLSGCEDMSSESCETPWSPVLLDITEPNGETVSIPWLKSF
ncbi:MAG: hypothetical protein J6A01_11240, partial [Proteobacteria bacterium]|nr:hypothetical protein [Pseudomonadota bacterium]